MYLLYIKKTKTMKLTEKQLSNIITEAIKKVLKENSNSLNSLNKNVNEAIRGELGMSKDERINRRIDNYMEDYPDMEYGDTIYPEIGEEHREKANRNRLYKHYRNHPKHKGLKYQIDEE
jgi:lipopolysaccharide biosynthesis regulator YciM